MKASSTLLISRHRRREHLQQIHRVDLRQWGNPRGCAALPGAVHAGNSFYEQKYNGFTYSDEVLESYFEENQQTLTVYSYKSYTLNAEFDIDASDDVKE